MFELLGSDLLPVPADCVPRAFCNHMGSEVKANTMEVEMQNESKELGERAQWKTLDQAVPEAHMVSSPRTFSYTSQKNPH